MLIHDASIVVIGKAHDIKVIDQLYKSFYKEGFHGPNIAYMGGDWVWIKFQK